MLYFLECLDIWILVRQAGSAFTGSRDFLWFFFFGKLGLERTFDPEGNRQQSWAEVLFSIVVKLEITKKYPVQKWKKSAIWNGKRFIIWTLSSNVYLLAFIKVKRNEFKWQQFSCFSWETNCTFPKFFLPFQVFP